MNIFKSINKKEFGRYLIFQILLFIVYSLTNSLVLSFALADMQQAMLTGITDNHNRAIYILFSLFRKIKNNHGKISKWVVGLIVKIKKYKDKE